MVLISSVHTRASCRAAQIRCSGARDGFRKGRINIPSFKTIKDQYRYHNSESKIIQEFQERLSDNRKLERLSQNCRECKRCTDLKLSSMGSALDDKMV